MDENLKSVNLFLIKAKQLISQNRCNLCSDRSKNKQFMEKYGLTRKDCFRIISNLRSNHMIAGPEEETNPNYPPGTVFIFIKREKIDDQMVAAYIKLKILDGREELVIISCHESSKEDQGYG